MLPVTGHTRLCNSWMRASAKRVEYEGDDDSCLLSVSPFEEDEFFAVDGVLL